MVQLGGECMNNIMKLPGLCIGAIKIMLKYAKKHTIIKLLLLGIAAVLTPLGIFFTQKLVDTAMEFVTEGTGGNMLPIYAVLLLLSLFFSSTGGFFDSRIFISMKRILNETLTPVILEKFRVLKYECFEDRSVRDTLQRMSTDPQENILNIFLNVTSTATLLISIIGMTFVYSQASSWFAVTFVALIVLMTFFDFKTSNMMNEMFNSQSEAERRMNYYGELLSTKHSLLELRVFGSVGYMVKKWRSVSNKVLNERVGTTIRAQKYMFFSTLFFKAWSFFTILSLIYLLIDGEITVGLFTALITSTGTVLENSGELSHAMDNVARKIFLVEHYNRFMALPEIPDIKNDKIIESPEIRFEDVVFAYPNTDRKILNGVNLTINPGEHLAIVGENGAGKSTMIKLLLRLYSPDSGRITVNGTDIAKLSQEQLHGVFSAVFQDYGKYSFTLRENIAFGELSKLHDDSALRLALEQGLVDSISDDLDTNLGKIEDDGVDLSGGQWQRIAIARCCASNSAFVILDEPTAALDPLAECRIYESFARVMRGRGSVMISHRLASARMSDRIVVLSDGKITENGSHDDLLSKDGMYAKMWAAQSDWYKDE